MNIYKDGKNGGKEDKPFSNRGKGGVLLESWGGGDGGKVTYA